jgi:CCR4-NOT transcriptional regulation complex NOT5 subunit
LRAIDNEALDVKPIHNLRPDIEYYIESNQESDFKENDLMYEEIDLDNLLTSIAPVIAAPTTQPHPLSLLNGTSGGLISNTTTLMDLGMSSLGLQSYPLTTNS